MSSKKDRLREIGCDFWLYITWIFKTAQIVAFSSKNCRYGVLSQRLRLFDQVETKRKQRSEASKQRFSRPRILSTCLQPLKRHVFG